MEPLILKKYCDRLKNDVDYFAREVSRNLEPDSVVLDAGCGSGEFGVMKKSGASAKRIVGFDISEESLSRNTVIDEAVVGNLERLPFPDGMFDMVVCESVFEHLEHPKVVLSEFSRVLKKNGILVMRTFNIWNWANAVSAALPVGIRTKLKEILTDEPSEGTFETYYRCNSRRRLRHITTSVGLKEKVFITHGAWPGYWGNQAMVSFFAVYEKISDIRWLRFTKVLIVGVYSKE